jgi:hypothetical protein
LAVDIEAEVERVGLFEGRKTKRLECAMDAARLRAAKFYTADSVHPDRNVIHQAVAIASLAGGLTQNPLADVLRDLVMEEPEVPAVIEISEFCGASINEQGDYSNLADLGKRLPLGPPHTTEADLRANVERLEERFNRWTRAIWREWDGRLYLNNGDRGHHFAALYCQAVDQGRQLSLEYLVSVHHLNDEAIAAMAGRDVFLVDQRTADELLLAVASIDDDAWMTIIRPLSGGGEVGILAFDSAAWYAEAVRQRLLHAPDSALDLASYVSLAASRQPEYRARRRW